MIQHLLYNLGVTPDWDTLVAVIEVVVVIGHADWQATNNEGWQFSGCLAPLLLGIALNQFLVDIAPYKGQGLLFQVARHLACYFSPLFFNFGGRFFWRHHTPELVEGVHIEGQVVDFPMIISDWGIDILVEFRKLVDVIPNGLVVSMENVGAKFMDLNARDFFRIDIARHVVALLNNQDALAFFGNFVGKGSAKEAGTYH